MDGRTRSTTTGAGRCTVRGHSAASAGSRWMGQKVPLALGFEECSGAGAVLRGAGGPSIFTASPVRILSRLPPR
ncbi:hypothetical protein CEP52_000242 [Fusarium oligoseptatum]|uniref:Uncharacterized protein n=1 Tax=Fusarium oligoseptatum TaxID=2604345 RepID=A0A428UQ53_9HYPO|nr:hypothetical protein CEP52_000242 [Fusarium oligoseptatum]